MRFNVGPLDRLAGIALAVLYVADVISEPIVSILAIMLVVVFLTGRTGHYPLYAACGSSTRQKRESGDAVRIHTKIPF